MEEISYFLGGRYFSKYFYVTCGVITFCCDGINENVNQTGWTIKNVDEVNIGTSLLYHNSRQDGVSVNLWRYPYKLTVSTGLPFRSSI